MSDFGRGGGVLPPHLTAGTPKPPRPTPEAPSPPSPRQAFGDITSAIGGLGERIRKGGDKALIRQVSMLGVDPRSAEGQQILDLLLMGLPVSTPEVKSLVENYQSKLIGPQSKKSLAPGVTAGPFNNQFGYTAGDEFSELDNLSTEYLARIQERMAALGMLKGHITGRKDQNTVKAFADLLWMSNAEGTSWIVQLSDLERTKEEMGEDWAFGDGGAGGAGPGPFVVPSYLAPDYADLAQTVKGKLRQALGRDPDESEMAMLTAELSGWDREAFDAEVAAERSTWEAAQLAAETGETQTAAPAGERVDPLARFKESFEQRFSAELSGIQRSEEAEQQQALTGGAVSRLSQMSGGMG